MGTTLYPPHPEIPATSLRHATLLAVTGTPSHEDQPRPHLARFLEAVAVIMGLTEGEQRLEIQFQNGYVRRWFTIGGPRGMRELAAYDDQAAWLTDRTRADELTT